MMLFALGRLLATPGALERLRRHGETPERYLDRHAAGDWGTVSPADSNANQRALLCGDRIMSSYTLGEDGTLWIITEANRASTTLLLPEEY